MKPYFQDSLTTLWHGDARSIHEPNGSVQTCVTSPPYWGLRDYGHADQIGLESTPDLYVANIVAVFREVWRVLKDDGTLWLNLGDSYSSGGRGGYDKTARRRPSAGMNRPDAGLKPKDLIGIPWLVAFALRSDGWYLRQDIIWEKPNAMPESVTDRCTKSHEHIFMLSKNEKYYYDHESIKEPGSGCSGGAAFGKVKHDGPGARRISDEDNSRIRGRDKQRGHSRRHEGFNDRWDAMERDEQVGGMVNKRDVWTVPVAGYPGAHFATFPPALIEPCILAGSRRGDVVLDPFNGSGTTGAVARKHGRKYVGVELNEDYLKLTHDRFAGPLFRLDTPTIPATVTSA